MLPCAIALLDTIEPLSLMCGGSTSDGVDREVEELEEDKGEEVGEDSGKGRGGRPALVLERLSGTTGRGGNDAGGPLLSAGDETVIGVGACAADAAAKAPPMSWLVKLKKRKRRKCVRVYVSIKHEPYLDSWWVTSCRQ